MSLKVVMCSLATLSRPTNLSKAALEDLERLTSLFNSSASECQPAARLLVRPPNPHCITDKKLNGHLACYSKLASKSI